MANLFRYTRSPATRSLFDWMLAVRGILFVGRRFTCPCCGWRLRAFTHGDGSLRTRPNGYCPRCNAKARHRRDWLFLRQSTNLFADDLRLLHISPKYSLARRFARMPNLEYVAGDIKDRPYVAVRFDLAGLPFRSGAFDAAICIHVLEHVEHDRAAMEELFRILRPGGWAFVSVPVRLDQPTYEDATITAPEARRRAFGETDHRRWYGSDLIDRLAECGFIVTLDRAQALPEDLKARYGLLADENIFLCTKPIEGSPGAGASLPTAPVE
ncbi:MAG: class I SAM-dependent methyltransferase [Acidimicrobiia bacterium]|nr:class I SAM-dependent methyltransferase [Acidimicrobiia bacterium]